MIRIREGAVLDDKQKRVIFEIQPFTEGVTLEVTRGHDSPLGQLATIESYAKREACLFSEFESGNLHDRVDIWIDGQKRNVYRWQQTWSALLGKGVIINPPLAAECLFDYFTGERVNKKGILINPSPHILSDPIDFSARIDKGMQTERADLPFVVSIMEKAKMSGAGIRKIKPEPKNGCCHIDLI